MSKIYNLEVARDSNAKEYQFNIGQEVQQEYSPTYVEVLRILREAFSLVDITQIIKKYN